MEEIDKPWVRITYLLPITRADDRTAYLRVLNYLRSKHPRDDDSPTPEPTVVGFTFSQDDPPAFQGLWWSSAGHGWILDDLVLLFLDRPGSLGDSGVLSEARTIKSQIERFYEEEGSPQTGGIWCTAQEIHLL